MHLNKLETSAEGKTGISLITQITWIESNIQVHLMSELSEKLTAIKPLSDS
jgi:hypothetical protein